MSDGTTAIVATVHDGKVTVANAGDSRCILVRRGGTALALSDDHKPSREDEVTRIRDLGGKVIYWGRWRVQGVLAVSRAIGDVNLQPYITAVPEVMHHDIGANDLFLVLATDGLWDVMSNDDVAVFVTKNREFKDVARSLCHEGRPTDSFIHPRSWCPRLCSLTHCSHAFPSFVPDQPCCWDPLTTSPFWWLI